MTPWIEKPVPFNIGQGAAAEATPAGPDPYIWWDFSDVSTVTKDGSNIVSQVDDKSGNDFHLTVGAPDATAKPLWVSSGQNGNNDLDFDGDKFMATYMAGLLVATPSTIFIVCEASDNAGGDRSPLGFKKAGAYQGDMYLPRTAAGANQFYFAQIGAASAFFETGIIDTWHTWTSISTSGASSLRMDGVEKATNTATGSSTPDQVIIGTNHLFNSYLDRSIGEIRIYNEELTTDQIETIEATLKTKWGTP